MDNIGSQSSRAHAPFLQASAANRWSNCPGSAVVATAYPNQDTVFTREGTTAHEVAEQYVNCRLEGMGEPQYRRMRDQVTPEMEECARGYADYVQEQIKSDDAVVFLERRVDYSPWAPGGFGTSDCTILQDNEAVIIDYKYGQGVAVEAEGNEQLRLYALGVLNEFGFMYDIDVFHMHIYQPRLNNISSASISKEELLQWAEEVIEPAAEEVLSGDAKFHAGVWCRFCPHAGRCRELHTTCTEIVESYDIRVKAPVMADWEVAKVLEMEPVITLWLKRVKEQAMTKLLNGDSVPGYKLVEGRGGNRKWTDELKVAEALKDAGYQPGDITETKLLSPAAMDKSIGKAKVAELLGDLIEKSAGAPTVVPASDKRPAYSRADEFENLN